MHPLRRTILELTSLCFIAIGATNSSGSSVEIEVGGFDPITKLRDPSEPITLGRSPGYFRVDGDSGFWATPMFAIDLYENPASDVVRDAFLLDFPFMAYIPSVTLGTQYASMYQSGTGLFYDGLLYYSADPMTVLGVRPFNLETALANAVIPVADNTVNFRMQPILTGTEGPENTLFWNTQPALWNDYLDPPTRTYWSDMRHDDGRSGYGPTAVNFDELVHDVIRQQIDAYYPNDPVGNVTRFNNFMNVPWQSGQGGMTPFEKAVETWGLRLVIQMFVVRKIVPSVGVTDSVIISEGLKDIENTNPINAEYELDYPEIVLSPSTQVVFVDLGPTGLGNNIASPFSINAVNGWVSLNATGLYSKLRVRWHDSAGHQFLSQLSFDKPGHWKFQVPSGASPGVAAITHYIKPNGQSYPPLNPTISFYIP